MISKRLTKTQKAEILEAFKACVNINLLADKYSCSSNTILRTVKSFLSNSEYLLLKEKRSNTSNKKKRDFSNLIVHDRNEDSLFSDTLTPDKLNGNCSASAIELVDEYIDTESKTIASDSLKDSDYSDSYIRSNVISNSENEINED